MVQARMLARFAHPNIVRVDRGPRYDGKAAKLLAARVGSDTGDR